MSDRLRYIKSQALLDEQTVISTMAYVDLKPVRADMAPTPEQSDHTSVRLSIEYWRNKSKELQGEGSLDNDENLSLNPLCLY